MQIRKSDSSSVNNMKALNAPIRRTCSPTIRCSSSSSSSSSSSVASDATSDEDFYQFLKLHKPEPTRGGSAQISNVADGVLTPASLASAATSAIGVEEIWQNDGQEELFGPGCQDASQFRESVEWGVHPRFKSLVLDGARKRNDIRRRSSICNDGSAGFMIATVDNTPVISSASTTRPSLQLPSWLKRPPAPAPVQSHSIFSDCFLCQHVRIFL